MNVFSVAGKIKSMPILKETPTGLKTCELNLIVARNFPNSDGVYENDEMCIEVWRGLAQSVVDTCSIGDWVALSGRIASRIYKKDDRTYLNYSFIAERMDFIRN
jgi:single-strand DNA-binding protein